MPNFKNLAYLLNDKTPLEKVAKILALPTGTPITAAHLAKLKSGEWQVILKGYEAHHIMPISLIKTPAFKFLSKFGDFGADNAEGVSNTFSNFYNGLTKNADGNPLNAIFVRSVEHGSHSQYTTKIKNYFENWLIDEVADFDSSISTLSRVIPEGETISPAMSAALAYLNKADNLSNATQIANDMKNRIETIANKLRNHITTESIVGNTNINDFVLDNAFFASL